MAERERLEAAVRAAGLDNVEGAFAFAGGLEFVKPGLGHRRRTKLSLADGSGARQSVYLKRYGPVKLTRRVRAALIGQDSTACREAANVQAVQAAGVATMDVLAWGAQGGKSFVLVTSVPGESLEKCFQGFYAGRQDRAAALAEQLADLVARLHSAGLVHRDLYASHVFLEELPEGARLYLIDLARVFRPRWRRFRWFAKDLAALKYSMPGNWVTEYWGQFLAGYLSRCGQANAGAQPKWEATIDRKAAAMREHDRRRWARASRRGQTQTA